MVHLFPIPCSDLYSATCNDSSFCVWYLLFRLMTCIYSVADQVLPSKKGKKNNSLSHQLTCRKLYLSCRDSSGRIADWWWVFFSRLNSLVTAIHANRHISNGGRNHTTDRKGYDKDQLLQSYSKIPISSCEAPLHLDRVIWHSSDCLAYRHWWWTNEGFTSPPNTSLLHTQSMGTTNGSKQWNRVFVTC